MTFWTENWRVWKLEYPSPIFTAWGLLQLLRNFGEAPGLASPLVQQMQSNKVFMWKVQMKKIWIFIGCFGCFGCLGAFVGFNWGCLFFCKTGDAAACSCSDSIPVRNKGECVKAGDPESCSIKWSELHLWRSTVDHAWTQGGRTSAAPEFTGRMRSGDVFGFLTC